MSTVFSANELRTPDEGSSSLLTFQALPPVTCPSYSFPPSPTAGPGTVPVGHGLRCPNPTLPVSEASTLGHCWGLGATIFSAKSRQAPLSAASGCHVCQAQSSSRIAWLRHCLVHLLAMSAPGKNATVLITQHVSRDGCQDPGLVR